MGGLQFVEILLGVAGCEAGDAASAGFCWIASKSWYICPINFSSGAIYRIVTCINSSLASRKDRMFVAIAVSSVTLSVFVPLLEIVRAALVTVVEASNVTSSANVRTPTSE